MVGVCMCDVFVRWLYVVCVSMSVVVCVSVCFIVYVLVCVSYV